jgi:hypothetical protein
MHVANFSPAVQPERKTRVWFDCTLWQNVYEVFGVAKKEIGGGNGRCFVIDPFWFVVFFMFFVDWAVDYGQNDPGKHFAAVQKTTKRRSLSSISNLKETK